MSNWYKISKIEDIPKMGSRIVEINNIDIAIFRTNNDSIYAINNTCPHKQGKLSEGLVHGDVVTCPLHNTDISLKSGESLNQNYECTKKYETKIDNDLVYLQF
ncbi:MAG: nitrite reductase small subunit NirD [Sulfurovum sp.]|jgi:nitrite reductase (NADH) small subunit